MKKLFSRVLFGILFCMCILFANKETAEASIYLDMDNTTITEENAVVGVISRAGNVPIKTITIVVKKDGEEIKRFVSEMNTHESKRYTFDFKNDLGITLEKDSLYEYTVIQNFAFLGEKDVTVGQFYTGDDCHVTVYMLNNTVDKGVFRSECITGLTVGDRFVYNAEMNCKQGGIEYAKDNLQSEYIIECLSANSNENIILNEYVMTIVDGQQTYTPGGAYLRDSVTGMVIEECAVCIPWREWQKETVYIPKDVIKINEKCYMYDAKRTGKTYIIRPWELFYNNIFDIYYKPCSVPGETTSVTVQYMDASTNSMIKTETIADQKIGNAYEYLPVNTFSNGTYQYAYCAEDTRNELKIDKLWTNPENNILTVYYKLAPENNDAATSDQTASGEQPQNQTNTIQKEKPVIKKAKPAIKKISRKNKSAIKIKFSKIKNAQGYEICYSTKKSFKKSVTKRVKKTTVTLKNLKKRKTYYVRVRGYQTIDGKVYYSKYSKVKRI